MAHHDVKTDSPVFQAMLRGDKNFEVRFNDRDYQVGDTITSHETLHTGVEMKMRHDGRFPGCSVAGAPLVYTGEEMELVVNYVLAGPVYGIERGWVVMDVTIIDAGITGPDH